MISSWFVISNFEAKSKRQEKKQCNDVVTECYVYEKCIVTCFVMIPQELKFNRIFLNSRLQNKWCTYLFIRPMWAIHILKITCLFWSLVADRKFEQHKSNVENCNAFVSPRYHPFLLSSSNDFKRLQQSSSSSSNQDNTPMSIYIWGRGDYGHR